MLFVLIYNYVFQILRILLIWIRVVPSVRSLNNYLNQIGQAGILVFEGIYYIYYGSVRLSVSLLHPKDKGMNLMFVN